MVCLINEHKSTSDTGGWCNWAIGGGHVTDSRLASALANLFAGQTVIGLGDGLGEYRRIILSTGKVRTYDAYDGSPDIHNVTGGKVMLNKAFIRLNDVQTGHILLAVIVD